MLSLGDGEPLEHLHQIESTQFPFPLIKNKMSLVEKSSSNQFPFSIFFHGMFLWSLKIWKQIRCGPSVWSIVRTLCMTCGPWPMGQMILQGGSHLSCTVHTGSDKDSLYVIFFKKISPQSGKWRRFFSIPFYSPPVTDVWINRSEHVGKRTSCHAAVARGRAHRPPRCYRRACYSPPNQTRATVRQLLALFPAVPSARKFVWQWQVAEVACVRAKAVRTACGETSATAFFGTDRAAAATLNEPAK
jgi:hypothetical protein